MDRDPPPQPAELPRPRERLAIAALASAAFALNLNTNVLGALLPFLRVAGVVAPDGTDGEVLLAASAYGSAVGALLALPLANRWGRRATLASAMGGFVVLSLAHLLAGGFWTLLALRAGAGAAVGVAYAAASALAAEVTPYGRRGAAMGWFNAGMFLAIPVGLPVTVAFARSGSWSGVFLVQAAVGALGCWWSLRALPAASAAPPSERSERLLDVLGNGPVRAGLLATMLHVGSFFTTVQLATTWLDATGRVPRDDQAGLWVGLGLGSVAGSALLARLSDRTGKRNFVLATSAVLVACFGFLAREPDGLLLLGLGTLLAVTAAARTGPLQALVSGLVPRHQFTALMGLRGAVMQVGVGLFASAAGPVSRELGFQGVLMLAAACQLLSYLAIRFGVKEPRPAR